MNCEVIIPNYDRAPLLRRTLSALRDQTQPIGVCVVDNGSRDESREMLAADFAWVRVEPMSTNVGFGAACNAGVRSSRADTVLLLNNDVVPTPDFVSRLAPAEHLCLNGAMISPVLTQPSGLVDSYGIGIDSNFNAYDVGRGAEVETLSGPDAPVALAPTGGAALYDRQSFVDVGGFDPEIFAYLEDVDLGIRLWIAGSRWAGLPDALATHLHSATLGARSTRKNHLMAQNKAYLLQKYRRLLGHKVVAAGYLSELIVAAGKVVTDRNLGAVSGLVSGVRHHAKPLEAGDRAVNLDEALTQANFREGLSRRLDRRR